MVVLSILITLVIPLILGGMRVIPEGVAIGVAVGMPIINFVIAGLITAAVIKNRIPDETARTVINKRNLAINIGAVLGYGVGWLVTIALFTK